MEFQEIVNRHGKLSWGDPPEKIDQLIDDLMCAEEMDEIERGLVSCGYTLGLLTALCYARHGKPINDAISRLTQFLLITEIHSGLGG